MRIGYACINNTLGKKGSFQTMTKTWFEKNINEPNTLKVLKQRTLNNLENTLNILKWNVEHNIFMYRLSSDLIPLATHQASWNWAQDQEVLHICNKIKSFIVQYDIRTSFHPSQFTVLTNWENELVTFGSIKELEYHNTLCDLLGCETILIHIGGVYGNKQKAIETFISNFIKLPESIQNKLHLENDDKSYNTEEVLEICETIGVPMILDLHHDRCLRSSTPIEFYIDRIIKTWNSKIPKIHLSTGRDNTNDKKHADYVSNTDYIWAINVTGGKFDIMFECKEKEKSTLNFIESIKKVS